MASGKKYSLLSYEKQPPPFIVFDLYNKELNTLRGCFVIKKTRNYLKIVRARLTAGPRPRMRHPAFGHLHLEEPLDAHVPERGFLRE